MDRLADLAARLLDAPSAQVLLLRDGRGVVAGSAGDGRATPGARVDVAVEVCDLVVQGAGPLVVPDARADARTAGRAAVLAGRVGAYLGVPLVEAGGVIGVLCVTDPVPRRWGPGDLRALEQLAAAAVAELELARLSADLEDSRLRTALAADAAGVGGFDWDLDTGALRWDDRLLDLFGYERSAFTEHIDAFNARLHPDDLARVSAALEASIAARGGFAADYRIVRPDGGVRWITARGRVLSDPGGAAVRLVGAAYDTTQARDGDARLSRVLEVMPAGFLTMDRDFRVTYLNGEGERILSTARGDAVGRVLFDLYPATRGTVYEQTYRRVAASGRPETFEAHYPEPFDAWYELRVWPSEDGGLSLYFLDITARRVAQDRADRAAARLALLARTTAELTEVLDAPTAVARLAQTVVPALADWCVVSLLEGDGTLRDVGWSHTDPALVAVVGRYASARLRRLDPRAALLRSLATGQPVAVEAGATAAVTDVLGDDEARALVRQLAPDSYRALPLTGRDGTLGVLTLYCGAGRAAEPEDVATAEEVAARAGAALDNARLYEQQRELAEQLQRSLLTDPPEPDHCEVVVRYHPAAQVAQVGGDWYDAFLQRGGATVVVIGDVIGHDTAAAAAMGQLRGLLRGIAATTGAGPAEVLARLDGAVELLQVPTTATAAVLRLEQDDDQRARGATSLRFSTAGHPPPMVLHADGRVEVLDAEDPDLLLGIDASTARTEHVVEVDRGSAVLLYTDGLVERRGQSLDDGLALLARELAALAGRSAQELCDGVLAAMLPERPEDDVALVLVRLHDQDAPRPPEAGPNRVPGVVPDDPAA